MRKTLMAIQSKEHSTEISNFLNELDKELADIVDVLNEADESNAVERCKAVAERLDVFYQQL